MKFEKHVLKNGLRTIFVPQTGTGTATVVVLVRTGAENESPNIAGMAHFLEHVTFKGTKNRPTASHITHEFDALGAEYNAFTDREMTAYHAKARKSELHKIIDILSDIYINSTFPHDELEKEKGVVVEEIHMYDDQPQSVASKLARSALLGDGPFGREIIGSKTTVMALDEIKVKKFHDTYYSAPNTCIVVAGDFDVNDTRAEIAEKFGDLLETQVPERVAFDPKLFSMGVYKSKKKIGSQAHVAISFPSFSHKDKEKTATMMLGHMLGGGLGSRLSHQIREVLGAAYYVYSYQDSRSDYGTFEIRAGLSKEKLHASLEAIGREMKAFTAGDFTDEELTRAKHSLSGSISLGLETSDALALYFGTQEILRRPLTTPEEKIAEIFAIEKKDIVHVAKAVFAMDRFSMSAVGPLASSDPLAKSFKKGFSEN